MPNRFGIAMTNTVVVIQPDNALPPILPGERYELTESSDVFSTLAPLSLVGILRSVFLRGKRRSLRFVLFRCAGPIASSIGDKFGDS